jgi:hypothetical protein
LGGVESNQAVVLWLNYILEAFSSFFSLGGKCQIEELWTVEAGV